MDPVSTCNTAAANVCSPIVRFLTPSKESKCSCAHWKSPVGFKGLHPLWEESMISVPDLPANPGLNGPFLILPKADGLVTNVGPALLGRGNSHPDTPTRPVALMPHASPAFVSSVQT